MRGYAFVSWLLFSAGLIAHEVNSWDIPLPHSYAALGDSMTEALLSDYSVETGIPNADLVRMMKFLEISDPTERLVSFRSNYAALDKSWATGGDEENLVVSHYERLKAYVPDIEAFNFSVTGAESIDLAHQVDAVLSYQDQRSFSFDYVTIMIGANDVGSETLDGITAPPIFVGRIETALRRLLNQNPDLEALVVGVPDIQSVFKDTEGLVVKRVLGNDISCGFIRRTIYGDFAVFKVEDEELTGQVTEILSQYRLGTTEMVNRLQEEFPSAHLKTIQNLRSKQLTKKLVSVDCFHPSEWGQAELAEKTWLAGFWPNLGIEF